MKWLTTIWALYLLMLSVAPCSDASNICEDGSITISQQSHDHNKDADDNCTPFCQCTCCSLVVTVYDFNLSEALHPVEQFVVEKIAIRKVSFISDYYGNIWQPPKISA